MSHELYSCGFHRIYMNTICLTLFNAFVFNWRIICFQEMLEKFTHKHTCLTNFSLVISACIWKYFIMFTFIYTLFWYFCITGKMKINASFKRMWLYLFTKLYSFISSEFCFHILCLYNDFFNCFEMIPTFYFLYNWISITIHQLAKIRLFRRVVVYAIWCC